ncbi:MAG: hypothetical protein ABJO45_04710 [Lentilitoribacter sp.]
MKTVALFIPREIDGHRIVFRHILESLIAYGQNLDIIIAGELQSYQDDNIVPPYLRDKVKFRDIYFKKTSYHEHLSRHGIPKFVTKAYMQPMDVGYSLTDCDLWIFPAGSVQMFHQPFAPTRPYITFASRLPRFSSDDGRTPEEINFCLDYLLHLRAAERVLSPSTDTSNRLTSYAGVSARKVKTLPFPYEPLPEVKSKSKAKKGYLLWCTDGDRSNEWDRALTIIDLLYEQYDFDKEIVICSNPREKDGDYSNRLVETKSGFWKMLVESIENDDTSRRSIATATTSKDFTAILNQASAVFHFRKRGPTPFILIDAGKAGVPVFSSRYPAAENAAQLAGTSVCFFDLATSTNEEIAQLIATNKNFEKLESDVALKNRNEHKEDWARAIMDVLDEV